MTTTRSPPAQTAPSPEARALETASPDEDRDAAVPLVAVFRRFRARGIFLADCADAEALRVDSRRLQRVAHRLHPPITELQVVGVRAPRVGVPFERQFRVWVLLHEGRDIRDLGLLAR